MRERFLPSGRVRFFPMSEYDDAGQIRSLLSGETCEVAIGKKIVDASYFQTSVPATHARRYQVADNVRVVSPNALPAIAPSHRRFTIVGAGKTAMDVGVWLLQSGASPQSIRSIVPRNSWLINRETTQPGDEFYHQFLAGRAVQMEAAAEASSVADLFLRLERGGQMLRIDPSVMPTMYRSATISAGEVEALRCIKNVVRFGRVKRIERGARRPGGWRSRDDGRGSLCRLHCQRIGETSHAAGLRGRQNHDSDRSRGSVLPERRLDRACGGPIRRRRAEEPALPSAGAAELIRRLVADDAGRIEGPEAVG